MKSTDEVELHNSSFEQGFRFESLIFELSDISRLKAYFKIVLIHKFMF